MPAVARLDAHFDPWQVRQRLARLEPRLACDVVLRAQSIRTRRRVHTCCQLYTCTLEPELPASTTIAKSRPRCHAEKAGARASRCASSETPGAGAAVSADVRTAAEAVCASAGLRRRRFAPAPAKRARSSSRPASSSIASPSGRDFSCSVTAAVALNLKAFAPSARVRGPRAVFTGRARAHMADREFALEERGAPQPRTARAAEGLGSSAT